MIPYTSLSSSQRSSSSHRPPVPGTFRRESRALRTRYGKLLHSLTGIGRRGLLHPVSKAIIASKCPKAQAAV
jgi:hypothetical protein